MIDRGLRVLGVMQLVGFAAFLGLCLTKGRPEANAHPDVRGGGDWGFGGTDKGRP
jgi:hypothetical protein